MAAVVFLNDTADINLLKGSYGSRQKDLFYVLVKRHAKKLDLLAEYCFHPSRKWRFDLAVPSRKIAFEYEGVFAKHNTRHSKAIGYSKDCEKYNHAALMGWRVYRFTAFNFSSQGKTKKTTQFLKKVFNG